MSVVWKTRQAAAATSGPGRVLVWGCPWGMNEFLVRSAVEYLRIRAVHVTGLFSVKSSLTTVKALKQSFDVDGTTDVHVLRLIVDFMLGTPVNLSEVENPHVVANLLLHYFRWLDQPLFTFVFYDKLLAIGGEGKRRASCRLFLRQLA